MLKWIFADDIAVQDKKRLVVFAEYFFGQLQRTGCAEWFCLDAESDLDVVPLPVRFEGFCHDIGAIIDGENDVGDTSSRQRLDLVKDHGSVGEFDEGLRESEGQRSQAGAEAPDEDERCTASEEARLKIARDHEYLSCLLLVGALAV